MKKDESNNQDRMIDALLREDARGGADEEFLSQLDRAMEAAGEGGEVETRERASGRPWPWAWGVAAAACVGAVVGYQVFFGEDSRRATADHALGSRVKQDREMREAPNAPGLESAALQGPEEKSPQPLASAPGSQNAGSESPLIARVEPGKDRDETYFEISRGGKETKPVAPLISRGAPVAVPVVRGRTTGLMGRSDNLQLGSEADLEERERRNRPNWQQDGEHKLDAAPVDRERYGQLVDQPWNTPWQAALSTFSVDVDTASYTNIRRMLRSGATIPKDAVRTEECINYFDYAYPKPQGDGPFAVHVEMASCPWKAEHHLVKIGLKGKEVDSNTRPASNLVFLIDVSGSMKSADKLPLLVESMKILVEELDERDSVGIVVYAGSAGTILEPTKVVGNGRNEILSALDHLRAGGSTAGAAGIRGAYDLAARHRVQGGVNRVILATDGDFNVGTSSTGELVDLVKERAKSGVFLSVLGFGTGNVNDGMLEAITNDGNGNYFYIDSQREGRKVFLQNLSGTLVTIAKDVKIQVEFNPGKVAAYRLIGYANRVLPPEAFNDDRVDAGDIGAGHTVTALYEIVPVGVEPPQIGKVDGLKYQKPANRAAVESPEWMTVKLRYKAPDGDKSTLLEVPVKNEPMNWTNASCDFQMAAGAALFGEKLRQTGMIDDAGWDLVATLAQKGSAHDPHGHRAEFLELVRLAGRLPEPPRPGEAPAIPIPAVEAPVAR